MMTKTSRPSRRNASHRRSCVWKGTEFANKVIYHFVAYDVVDMVCFFYKETVTSMLVITGAN